MRERERGRAGKRRNQILKERSPIFALREALSRGLSMYKGWWKKKGGSKLGHRAKAARKMKKSQHPK